MDELRINSEVLRVFGDSELDVYIGGGIVKASYNSLKSMRLFEVLMRGRKYYEVPYIAARICGACSQAHFWASVLAVESALGIEVSEDTAKLRDACNKVELIQNHVIHLTYMALPDYLDDISNIAKLAIRLNSKLVKALELIGGRLTNPNIYKPGGFTDKVTGNHVKKALEILRSIREDLMKFTDSILSLNIPELKDPSPNYLTLHNAPIETVPSGKYMIASSSGELLNLNSYGGVLEEVEVSNSTSRKCSYRGRAFYVGSRARTLNLVRNSGINLPINVLRILRLLESNPFGNIYAKAVESLTVFDHVLNMLEEFSLRGLKLSNLNSMRFNEGVGLGVVEAPRGLLIHYYRFNGELRVMEADIITPTVMNTLHIERSSEALVRHLLESGVTNVDTIRKYVECLVRAYDPCIVCAVHVIRR